jgi:hypothetical protein
MIKGEKREAQRQKKRKAPKGSQAQGLAHYHLNGGHVRKSGEKLDLMRKRSKPQKSQQVFFI